MQTDYFILHLSSQGKPVKKTVDSHKNWSFIVRILLYLLCALVSESEIYVDLAVLVVSSDQVNLFGIQAFEGQQQANGL